jgi:purine-binding chemotaxis protein CheW
VKPGKHARPMASPAFDWHAIRSRLDAVRTALEGGASPGPALTGRILKARAEALAREPAAAIDPHERIDVIEFLLAHETYAIESRFAREIHPLSDLTPLPCTPAYVRGIVNVRGQIISVIDLKRFFDLPAQGLTDLNKLIVVRSNAMEFGLLADRIIGTRNIAAGELQPSLPTLTGIREQYLRGISADQVVILDGARLLADRKLVVHELVEL